MRHFFVALALIGCRVAVDPGITYRTCERDPYVEPFDDGTTLENLAERCWDVDAPAPGTVRIEAGALVVGGTSGSADGATALQALDGDFVVVTRLDVRAASSGDRCLDVGDAAGIVVRRSDPVASTTFLLEPFVPEPNPGLSCDGEGALALPMRATVESVEGSWGPSHAEEGPDQSGIGAGGVATIAACREGGTLRFFHRDDAASAWIRVGGEALSHEPGTEPIDVGLTVRDLGAGPEVEGRFDWTLFQEPLDAGGCEATLDAIELPGGP